MGPDFAQVLLDIAEQRIGKRDHIAAAFQGRRFYLALPKPGGFMPLSGYHVDPEDYGEQCRKTLADLAIPRQVIDRLLGAA